MSDTQRIQDSAVPAADNTTSRSTLDPSPAHPAEPDPANGTGPLSRILDEIAEVYERTNAPTLPPDQKEKLRLQLLELVVEAEQAVQDLAGDQAIQPQIRKIFEKLAELKADLHA